MPLSRAGDFFLTLRRLQSMIQETTEALRADQPRWDRSSKVIPINRRRYGSRRGRLIIAITLVVGIAVACFYSVYHGAPPPIDPKSIAVLPFDNVGEEKQDEYFGDGLTTEVIFLSATSIHPRSPRSHRSHFLGDTPAFENLGPARKLAQ